MARPIKTGLQYFPLDVDIDQDDKVSVIEALHGAEGFSIIIKLLMKIYKEGYFYAWSKREQLIFSRRINVDINTLTAVVNDCIEEGLFNKRIYEGFEVLTSKGIQQRYLEAVKRRKEVGFIREYFLVEDVPAAIGTSKINVYLVNADGNNRTNIVNVNINPGSEGEDAGISTQSKVKESKVKESKEKEIKGNEAPALIVRNDSFNPVQCLIDNNIINAMGITHTLNEDLNDIYDNFGFTEPDAVIEEAIKVAVRGNGKTWAFIRRRLLFWQKLGVKTLADARAEEDKKGTFNKASEKGGHTSATDQPGFADDWKKARDQRGNRTANF